MKTLQVLLAGVSLSWVLLVSGCKGETKTSSVGTTPQVEARVEKLLSQMTLQEKKIDQMTQGFHTVFPIPIGQAASFDPELVREGARIAALEATAQGVRWTFSPIRDVYLPPFEVGVKAGAMTVMTSLLRTISGKWNRGRQCPRRACFI